jgi:hypothetical protein
MTKKIIDTQIVNNFIRVHPALDFTNGSGMVTIKCQLRERYTVGKDEDNIKVSLRDGFYTILSNGDAFIYSPEELSKRELYYSGKLDIVKMRWDNKDVEEFRKDRTSKSIYDMFQIIRNEFFYYVANDDGRIYDLLACFVLFTYFHPLFNYATIIHLWGNAGTGKTKVCSLLDALCFNPVNSANISAATLYRIIEGSRATVILDESEDLMGTEKGKEIINMLLAGIGKSGQVYRQEKTNDVFSTAIFRIFSPKIIANIKGIELPSILSRVIRIVMTGSKDKVILNRNVEIENKSWEFYRNQLYRMALLHYEEIKNVIGQLPEHKLNGRNFDIWEGILTIAYACDKEIFDGLITYAIENEMIIKQDIEIQEDDTTEVKSKLLELCKDEPYKATSTELLELLFPEYGSISKKELHARLSRFGIKINLGRINGKVTRYYELRKEKFV